MSNCLYAVIFGESRSSTSFSGNVSKRGELEEIRGKTLSFVTSYHLDALSAVCVCNAARNAHGKPQASRPLLRLRVFPTEYFSLSHFDVRF